MDKNYYHIQVSSKKKFAIEHAGSAESFKQIGSPKVTKFTYDNGDVCLQVVDGDVLDLYADFPIKLSD